MAHVISEQTSLVMLYLTDHSANCCLMPETDRI